MVIGIDASRANKKFKSGPEWYSYQLIRQFALFDSQNQYILYTNEPLSPDLLDLRPGADPAARTGRTADQDSQAILSPHGNFRVKLLKWPLNFFWTQGRLSLEMLLRPPDVLFVPAHAVPFISPGKTVNTIHDIGFEVDRKFYDPEIIGPDSRLGRKILDSLVKLATYGKYGANSKDYLSWSADFAVKKSKLVIVPSEFTKQEVVRQYQAGPDKIRVVPNGFDADCFRTGQSAEKIAQVLAKYDIIPPYLLCVGKLDTKKNTHALVQAFGIYKQRAKDRHTKLVLIGNASFGYDEVTYMMHEYGLDQDICMPGWLEQGEMPYVFAGAAAFIYPSLYEGFGIPLLEAMASGVPVAASNKGAIPEVAGDAALIFEPAKIPAMVDAIDKIINDQELRSRLAARGLARSAGYSWEKCARETHRLLISL